MRGAKATLSRLTPGRRYVVLDAPGREYLGRSGASGLHRFMHARGFEQMNDARLKELLEAGEIVPDVPR